jgi:RND family efflux transporter MFP subunit
MSYRDVQPQNGENRPAAMYAAHSQDDEPNWDAICDKFGGTKADTKPCRDVTMAFTIATEVQEVVALGGQVVKKGDLLVRARDDEQVAVVEGQKLQAENLNRIHNAELQKELADLTYNRMKQASAGGGANPMELDQRRIEAASAAVAVAQENTTHDLEVKRLAQAEGLLSRYRLNAPWDGIVEEVRVEAGQGVRESDPVVRVVDIKQLWLEPFTPTQETIRLGLKQGAKAWVLVSLPDKPMYVEGRVLYVSPVADSVSQTRRVRVEIDNPEGWPAGTPAMVRFTEPGPEWNENRLTVTKKTVSSAEGTPAASASDAR